MTDENQNDEQGGAPVEAYNPTAYTVPEVVEYLASADAAEVERVKAAEKEGKDRVGVMEWEPPLDAQDDGETVTLRVSAPHWTDGFNYPKNPADVGDGYHTVTRAGSEVPADLVDTIINAASQQGVTVERVEDETEEN